MSKEFISVVVPAYNEQAFIRPCLDALKSQRVPADLIIVVDNNCTDQTMEYVRQYDAVTVIEEHTQGICAATKRGLDEAASYGGVILRCDADCLPPNDWVETMMSNFKDPNVYAVTGPGVPHDSSAFGRAVFTWLYMKPYFKFVGLALGYAPLFGSNMGVRAHAWKEITTKTHLHERQDIHDDIDISFHLQGKIRMVPEMMMPLSGRPLRSARGMLRRSVAGFRSIFIHWPNQAPWRRRMDSH